MTKDEREYIDMAYEGIIRIDKNGIIWRCKKRFKTGYITIVPRKLGHNNHGYIRLGTSNKLGKIIHAQAHRLVFMYFYGDIQDGNIQVNHKDGVKHNNVLTNLELMTPSQQMIHAIEVLGRKVGNRTSGLNRKGAHPKLTKEDLEDVYRMHDQGMSTRQIAKVASVTQSSIMYRLKHRVEVL